MVKTIIKIKNRENDKKDEYLINTLNKFFKSTKHHEIEVIKRGMPKSPEVDKKMNYYELFKSLGNIFLIYLSIYVVGYINDNSSKIL